jgi:hypothetical protein
MTTATHRVAADRYGEMSNEALDARRRSARRTFAYSVRDEPSGQVRWIDALLTNPLSSRLPRRPSLAND